MSLELKNVEKKVGIDTHIHPTSLKLEKNTINVLLGSTLAGKTTLMQIMAGLDKPTSGEIWFNGKNVTGMKVQKRNVLWFISSLLIIQILQFMKILLHH